MAPRRALGLSMPKKNKNEPTTTTTAEPEEPHVSVQQSDIDLYKGRVTLWFAAGTPISDALPWAGTPEAQFAAAIAFNLFRLVRFRGGKNLLLEWHNQDCRPILVMTPALEFTLGADFYFGA